MMKWVFGIIISVSIVFSVFTKNISDVSNATINSGYKAVELTFSLIGSMGFWGGIMRIAEKSGLCDKISTLLSPVVSFLFKGIDRNSLAFRTISMNITANLLGLGNAATPLGLTAMKEIEKEEKPNTPHIATRNMIMLCVINSASIQLIPTTIATMRLMHGSQNPMSVLPCILIVSLISFIVSVSLVFALDKRKTYYKEEAYESD